jgi:hypothetical protein
LLALGCSDGRTEANSSAYVGEYVFKPMVDPGQSANYLILRADGTAVEFRYDKSTGNLSRHETTWHLDPTSDNPMVIGRSGFPVEHTSRQIRLRIDTDVDEYYLRVR